MRRRSGPGRHPMVRSDRGSRELISLFVFDVSLPKLYFGLVISERVFVCAPVSAWLS